MKRLTALTMALLLLAVSAFSQTLGINIRTGPTYAGGWTNMVKKLAQLKPAEIRTTMPRTYPHGDFELFQQIEDNVRTPKGLPPDLTLTAKLMPKDSITIALADAEKVIVECLRRGWKIKVDGPNEFDNVKALFPSKAPSDPATIRLLYWPLEIYWKELAALCYRYGIECELPSMTKDWAPVQGFAFMVKDPVLNLHYYGHPGFEAYYEKLRTLMEAVPASKRIATEFGYYKPENPTADPSSIYRWQIGKLGKFTRLILFELADSDAQEGFGQLNKDGTPKPGWDNTIQLFQEKNAA